MSTRSRIGLLTEDTIRSIYCHSDGYPDWVGRMLNEHWTDPDQVEQLLDLGDLSYLGSSLDYGDPSSEGTCAYHRDRGEPRKGTRAVAHEAGFSWPHSNQEYEYLGRVVDGVVQWEVRR